MDKKHRSKPAGGVFMSSGDVEQANSVMAKHKSNYKTNNLPCCKSLPPQSAHVCEQSLAADRFSALDFARRHFFYILKADKNYKEPITVTASV